MLAHAHGVEWQASDRDLARAEKESLGGWLAVPPPRVARCSQPSCV